MTAAGWSDGVEGRRQLLFEEKEPESKGNGDG